MEICVSSDIDAPRQVFDEKPICKPKNMHNPGTLVSNINFIYFLLMIEYAYCDQLSVFGECLRPSFYLFGVFVRFIPPSAGVPIHVLKMIPICPHDPIISTGFSWLPRHTKPVRDFRPGFMK
jgi:hypothetical protein